MYFPLPYVKMEYRDISLKLWGNFVVNKSDKRQTFFFLLQIKKKYIKSKWMLTLMIDGRIFLVQKYI